MRLHGERWNARSEVFLESGQVVRVVDMDGLTVVVEPTDATATGVNDEENAS